VGYDDGRIACTDTELVIRGYYVPRGTKRIRYEWIREATLRTGDAMRIWGSSDLRHWYNLDTARPDKVTALELDLGHWIRPVITPDDPDQVVAALRAHNVPVQ
jgi:hypothetical protein